MAGCGALAARVWRRRRHVPGCRAPALHRAERPIGSGHRLECANGGARLGCGPEPRRRGAVHRLMAGPVLDQPSSRWCGAVGRPVPAGDSPHHGAAGRGEHGAECAGLRPGHFGRRTVGDRTGPGGFGARRRLSRTGAPRQARGAEGGAAIAAGPSAVPALPPFRHRIRLLLLGPVRRPAGARLPASRRVRLFADIGRTLSDRLASERGCDRAGRGAPRRPDSHRLVVRHGRHIARSRPGRCCDLPAGRPGLAPRPLHRPSRNGLRHVPVAEQPEHVPFRSAGAWRRGRRRARIGPGDGTDARRSADVDAVRHVARRWRSRWRQVWRFARPG